MIQGSPRLANLIQALDAFSTAPSLIELSQALRSSAIDVDDVRSYVHETSTTYHRGLVLRRDNYELLVITWKPGQGSVPHDHSGSVSAMLVLQGIAAEGAYRIGEDGYADLEFENLLKPGELTAWHDAGVHSVRNPLSNSTLVTLNVYSPPLQGFRRFHERPKDRKLVRKTSTIPTVLIVGAGFSGSMTAAQLLRRSLRHDLPVRVLLAERQGTLGEGVAYSTRDPKHLLNVPAGRMSAWPDNPQDFVDWLTKTYGVADPTAFVPREWYGRYTRETLLDLANDPTSKSSLEIIMDEVRRVSRRPDGGWLVSFSNHASEPSDAVVLSIGHRPPSDPIGARWSGSRSRFIADPWQPFACSAIAPDDPVVILGTGLTAVDNVLSLATSDRTAPIYLISRRGLMPQQHSPAPIPAASLNEWVAEHMASPLSIRRFVRSLREEIQRTVQAGGDWRSVIDGLRPFTAQLWKALSHEDRQRFLRHVRPFWEVHRHRTAVQVAERFRALKETGRVKILAGRIVAVQADNEEVRVFVRERGDDRLLDLQAAWVINCTGPGPANSADSNPAIGSLLIPGWVSSDPLSLGLRTTDDGLAIGDRGRDTEDLYVVGTLRKPGLWETTAVPELRSQAAQVADSILRRLYASILANPETAWTI